MGRYKIHFAPNGEWGQPRTDCIRYWTCDVSTTEDLNKVTCKHCLKLIQKNIKIV